VRILKSWPLRDGTQRQIVCVNGPDDGGPWVTSAGYPLRVWRDGAHILRDEKEPNVVANMCACDCDETDGE